MKLATCEWLGKGECCSNDVLPGKNYCDEHYFLIYQKGTALGKRKKDIKVASRVHEWESLINEAAEELEAEGLEL